ncbi:BglG family transcription antiterminator [Anaerosacchariphilus polymeriproducens]|uniref:PRD domain-containing protein n=1 Tax=Anaerosacchariphilus polymeriproducens TaxID=1812858 RepID=A0A371AYL7_9FIRM|nr:PRD domain-containing protein [Anaerosacchariphilus polymeriproducens]RDU24688.1 PRD domain-containing protein [Anaerosacchariphilus polymeriproducens]
MMQFKQVELINYMLNNKAKVLTSQQLADALHVSIRSVKTYISQINDSGKGKVIISNKNGYMLNIPIAKSLLEQENKLVPQTYEDRSNYIIKLFFLNHTNCLDLFDLADDMFVSDSTLKMDIKKMNKRFKSFNIQFTIEKNNIKLTGPEKNIRKLFSYILYEEVDNHYMDLQVLKKNFVNVDVDSILPIIRKAFIKNNFYINDLALRNLLIHLIIIIERIIEGKTVSNVVLPSFDNEAENLCVSEICENLEQQFNIRISSEEKNEIYMLFKSSTNLVINNSMQDLTLLVGEEIVHQTKELVYLIKRQYSVDLDSENFIIPFALHLKNLLLRAKNSTYIKNPMLEMIKSQHLILFDIALFVSLQLSKRYQIIMGEDEVAFIALHIGGEIERQKNNNSKVSVVLLCPSYMKIESRLYNELLLNFNNDINIVASVKDTLQLEDMNFDLLVSTIKVKPKVHCEIAVISPFMTQGDKFEIQAKIESTQNNKKKKVLKKYFHDYFEEDLFFVCNKSYDMLQAIDLLTDNLLNMEYVRNDYKENVLTRERAASTAFGKIAIPHSVEMNAYKTCISVMISRSGIKWDKQRVNVILMIAINKQDNNAFRDLYESLAVIFSEENNIELIKECDSFELFESTLKSIIS